MSTSNRPRGKLSDRVAIVTGGGGLIGSVTATTLAAHGAAVVVADLDEASAASVAASIVDAGGSAIGAAFDMGSEQSVVDLMRVTLNTFGRLDILHNNAAPLHLVRRDPALLDMPLEVWDETMATMLRGVMLLCREAIPHLIAAGAGSIINMGSIQALVGDRTMPAYAAAKAAVLALTRSIATQYGAQNLRCNAICPGHIASDRVTGEARARLIRHQLLNRPGEPEDIANVVLFLASDDSKFMTGQVLVVDGGMTVHAPTYAEGGNFEIPNRVAEVEGSG